MPCLYGYFTLSQKYKKAAPQVLCAMPIIEDFELPSRIIDVFIEIIKSVSSRSINVYAKFHPEVLKGFRPNKINKKIVIQRLLVLLKSAGSLNPAVMALLADNGFNRQFVAVFSAEVLMNHLADLTGMFGEDKILAAMLVDSREDIRKLAVQYLQAYPEPEVDIRDRDEAKANLAQGLSPVAKHLSHIFLDVKDEPVLQKPNLSVIEKNNDKSKDKEAVKSFKKMEKSLKAKVCGREKEIAALNSRLQRETARVVELEVSLHDVLDNLDKLQAGAAAKIESGVSNAMKSAVRKWLLASKDIDSVADEIKSADEGGDDILSKVKLTLDKQAVVDRNYGNHRTLCRRLAELDTAQDKLLAAAKDSLNPLPDLSALCAELDYEKNRISRMLGTSLPKNPLLTKITVSINQVRDFSELERVTALLDALALENLLNDQEVKELLQQLDGCRQRFYDQYRPQAMTAEALLEQMIGGRGAQLFLLDGYNVLFGLPEYFAHLFDEDGKPGEAARGKLLSCLDQLFKGSVCLVNVFFDGETRAEENYSSCVKVVYSGGGDLHIPDRADQAIVDFLDSRLAASRKETVVTDDRELQARARQRGAAIMPLAQFASLLA